MADTLRKVDNLGRIVIPAEQRALTGLSYGVRFVSRVEDGKLIIESAEDTCPHCNGSGKETPEAAA